MKTEGLWKPALMPGQRATDAHEPRQRRPPGSCVDQPRRSGGWLFSEGRREPRRDPADKSISATSSEMLTRTSLQKRAEGLCSSAFPVLLGFPLPSLTATTTHTHMHAIAYFGPVPQVAAIRGSTRSYILFSGDLPLPRAQGTRDKYLLTMNE